MTLKFYKCACATPHLRKISNLTSKLVSTGQFTFDYEMLKRYMILKIVKQGTIWFSNMQIRYFTDLCEQCLKASEPALSLYGDLRAYYPHIKFLGITFDSRMTFVNHFEAILERCNQKFHSLRILVSKKWDPSPTNHFTNLQTMCETNIRIWDCFHCNHLIQIDIIIKNTKSPELFH